MEAIFPSLPRCCCSKVFNNHKSVVPQTLSMFQSCNKKPTSRSSSATLIRGFSFRKSTLEVFEDQSSGVICYIDETGQLICEGFDEGPRLSRFGSQKVGHGSWDKDIVDLLKQAREQFEKGPSNEESLFTNNGSLDFN